MHIMHVQVLRRGHGILIEVIDVGLLADVAFIGAMHIMPANQDEWLPPVDGFFDLVRNPQGGAVMRPWYESFDGVPVIELCLRGILAGTMPTMPIPTAPPAFAGISIDYPPFNPNCARHDAAAGSQVIGSTVNAGAASQVVGSTSVVNAIVAEVGGSAVQGRPVPPPPKVPPPTLDIKVGGAPPHGMIIQTKAPPTQPHPQAKAPPLSMQQVRSHSSQEEQAALQVRGLAREQVPSPPTNKQPSSGSCNREPRLVVPNRNVEEEEEGESIIMKLQTFHIDPLMFSREEWRSAAFLQTLSDGIPVPGGNGVTMNGFALGLVQSGETMLYQHTYAPHVWVTVPQVARSQVLHDALMKLVKAFDTAVEKHGSMMHGTLYGFHALRAWLVNIGLQQVVMGPMAAALAKQHILPSRHSGTWTWVPGPDGVAVNMIAHIGESFDFIEEKLMRCGAAVQLKVQPLQAPPVEAVDPEIAERNDQVLRSAFPRRSLLMSPVMHRPRRGMCLTVSGPAVRGHKMLAAQPCSDLNVDLLGLTAEPESWWVVSHGHWYPRCLNHSACCKFAGACPTRHGSLCACVTLIECGVCFCDWTCHISPRHRS